MSVAEARALDLSELLLGAYEMGDIVNSSAEVAEYLYWKEQVNLDEQVQQLVRQFDKKKQLFEECERFGHFHPNYHEALDEVRKVQEQLDQQEKVIRFKQAETRLDELLYTVSTIIANAVSESVIVPSNNPLPASGCGSGGKCNGGCG